MAYVSKVVPLVSCMLYFCAVAVAQEEEAVRVFRKVSPSVVTIEGLTSSGTGILLNKEGLILTNAHVVAVPLPYKCQIEVNRGGRYETVTFKDARLVGVHPKLDLALIRVDAKTHGGTLTPATLSKSPATPGQRVYAIGNPGSGGAEVKLTKTITTGLLSGVDRELEGVSYLQIDAAINPGNSGGPLCDKTGNVLGVVTLKLSELDNVGFAIPIGSFREAEFQPLEQRPRDVARAAKLIASATKLIVRRRELERRGQGQSEEAKLLRVLTFEVLHEALLADPTNGFIYSELAVYLDSFGETEAAREYHWAAIESTPFGPSPLHYARLADHLLKQRKPDEAQAVMLEAVAKHPHSAMACCVWLADRHLKERGDLEQALVFSQMAIRCPLEDNRWLDNYLEVFRAASHLAAQATIQLAVDPRAAQIRERLARLDEEMNRRTYFRNVCALHKRVELTPEFAQLTAQQSRSLTRKADLTSATKPRGDYASRTAEILTAARAVKGSTWSQAGTEMLVSPGTETCSIEASATLPEEYNLCLILERLAGKKECAIGLVYKGKPTMLILDYAGSKTGLAGLRSPMHEQPVLPLGQPVAIVCEVRRGSLCVRANEAAILTVSDSSELAVPPTKWGWNTSSSLCLGTQDSSVAVLSWRIDQLPAPQLSSPPPALARREPAKNPVGFGTAIPFAGEAAKTPSGEGATKPSAESEAPPVVASTTPAAKSEPAPSAVASTPPGNDVPVARMEPASPPAAPAASTGPFSAFSPGGNATPAANPQSGFNTALGYREIMRTPELGWGVRSLAFSPDGRYIVCGKMDNAIFVFDLQEKQRTMATERLENLGSILQVTFNPAGDLLLSAGSKGIIGVWDFRDGLIRPKKHFSGHTADVTALKVAPDGKRALSADDENRVRLWDIDTCRETYNWAILENDVTAIHFLAEQKHALVTDGRKIALLNLDDGTSQISNYELVGYTSGGSAFNRDGSLVAVVDGSGIKVFDVQSGKEQAKFKSSSSFTRNVMFAPDQVHMYTCGGESIEVWNLTTQSRVDTIPLDDSLSTDYIAVSRDGRRLTAISNSAGQKLQVFELDQMSFSAPDSTPRK